MLDLVAAPSKAVDRVKCQMYKRHDPNRSYYAAEKGIDEAAAIEHGLREKAQELQRVGADTCGKV